MKPTIKGFLPFALACCQLLAGEKLKPQTKNVDWAEIVPKPAKVTGTLSPLRILVNAQEVRSSAAEAKALFVNEVPVVVQSDANQFALETDADLLVFTSIPGGTKGSKIAEFRMPRLERAKVSPDGVEFFVSANVRSISANGRQLRVARGAASWKAPRETLERSEGNQVELFLKGPEPSRVYFFRIVKAGTGKPELVANEETAKEEDSGEEEESPFPTESLYQFQVSPLGVFGGNGSDFTLQVSWLPTFYELKSGLLLGAELGLAGLKKVGGGYFLSVTTEVEAWIPFSALYFARPGLGIRYWLGNGGFAPAVSVDLGANGDGLLSVSAISWAPTLGYSIVFGSAATFHEIRLGVILRW